MFFDRFRTAFKPNGKKNRLPDARTSCNIVSDKTSSGTEQRGCGSTRINNYRRIHVVFRFPVAAAVLHYVLPRSVRLMRSGRICGASRRLRGVNNGTGYMCRDRGKTVEKRNNRRRKSVRESGELLRRIARLQQQRRRRRDLTPGPSRGASAAAAINRTRTCISTATPPLVTVRLTVRPVSARLLYDDV